MESNTNNLNQKQLILELIQLGFQQKYVLEAIKHTTDKEKIVQIILRYNQLGPTANISDIVPPPVLPPVIENKFDESPFKFKMIFVVNGQLKMSKGKICSQVGHACLGAYLRIQDQARFDEKARMNLTSWETLGCAKIVVRGQNEKQLVNLEKKTQSLGINNYLVEDAGKTQVKQGSRTVLAIGPVASSVIDPLTSHLKLL